MVRTRAFKSVGERGCTYAAKMKIYNDFDELCTNKNLSSDEIHVFVTPCYQFLSCTPNLRTCATGKNKLNQTKESTIATTVLTNSEQEAQITFVQRERLKK